MNREALDTVTRLIGRARARQRPKLPEQGPIRVNLGSSLLVAPGWINIDGGLGALLAGLPRPLLRIAYRSSGMREQMSEEAFVDVLSSHRFVHHDLVYGIPFPDASVQAIFSSQFFEHLTHGHAERLAAEALRVLEPGGVIRISVPDFVWLVEEFQRGAKRAVIDGIFGADGSGDYARHRYMYDEELLGDLLATAGFTDITRCRFREGRVPDLDVLDNREGSLVMEAARPRSGALRSPQQPGRPPGSSPGS
ncbi:MAG: methyltransferase domain-containing protein [Thermoleophilaceae bacterium]|nr:methyltransferase domain-containing protein [Thermoleophilaceae bacterium]